jgi:type IV pilus assembly protein PilC
MPTYTYKVKNSAGKVFVGESNVKTKDELLKIFSSKELTPIEVKEKNFFNDITQIKIFKPKVKVKDLSMFCRQFAIVLDAGLPISTAMDVIRGQTSNVTLRVILNDVYESIQKGNSLSKSLKKHNVFPELLINMVESGEVSGQLDKIFNRMAEFFEKEYKINKRIQGAMIYPVVLVVISITVVFVLMTFVLPQFAEALDSFHVEYPLPTRVIMGISDFFKSYWFIIAGGFLAIALSISVYLKSYTGKKTMATLALKVPVVKNLVQNIITARFTRTLSTLLSSGVLLIEALEMVQKVIGNIIIKEKFEHVLDEVKKGKALTATINNMKFFPPLVISMLKIGEESGGLDFSLEKSADYYDQEVDASISQFLSMLEPAIIFFLAIIVGFILMSVMLPMVKMYENASF